MDRDRDFRAETGQSLVDGVVDDLVDEVVQAHHAGRADVHARALANRLKALENGDVLCVVARGAARHRRVVDSALAGAPLRAVAICGQWPSDDVRTPRNPGLLDHGPGREKYVNNHSRTGPWPEPSK